MKKMFKKKSYLLLKGLVGSFLAILVLTSCNSSGQDIQFDSNANAALSPRGDSPYLRAMNEAQIPEDELKTMSTKELLEALQNYPLLLSYKLYNSHQLGFEKLIEQYNGLAELMTRTDVGPATLAYYNTIDPSDISQIEKLADQGAFGTKISIIEILLAQNEVLATLSPEDQKDLLKEGLRKSEQKQKNGFGITGQESIAFMLSRTLQMHDGVAMEKSEAVKMLLENGTLYNEDATLSTVYNAARQLINEAEKKGL